MKEKDYTKELKNETAFEIGVHDVHELKNRPHRIKSAKENYIHSVNSISSSVKILLTISWIASALAAFISPYFAAVGVLAGVLASKRSKGIGTAAIITNIVLGLLNIIFSVLLISLM